VAYRAEIEIGVKGADKLKDFKEELKKINRILDITNKTRDVFELPLQNLQNYTKNLSEASRALKTVEMNTDAERAAVERYVQALGEANEARARQNQLIKSQVAAQEAARRTVSAGPTGFSSSSYRPGASPETVRISEVQQSWNKFFGLAGEIAEDLNKVAKARSSKVQQSWNLFFGQAAEIAEDLNKVAKARGSKIQQSWNLFFGQAAEVASDLNAQAKVRRLNIQSSWNKFFREAADIAEDLREGARNVTSGTGGKAAGGRFGAALVGGGFPLLFGGGPGGVLGGALGGAIGGKKFGFEASIGLGALGSVLDRLVGSARQLGDALAAPETALDQLQQVGFEVSASTEAQVRSLIEAGNRTEAYNLLLQETGVRPEQVNALRELDDAFDDLQNEVAGLFVALVTELSPAIIAVASLITDLFKNLKGSDVKRAAANLDPQAFQAAETEASRKASAGFLFGGDKDLKDSLLEEMSRDIVAKATPELAALDPLRQNNKDKPNKTKIKTSAEELIILQKQNSVIQAGNNLLNEKAFIAAQDVIGAQLVLDLKKAEGAQDKEALAFQKARNANDKLRQTRNKQQEQFDNAAARKAKTLSEKADRDAKRANAESARNLRAADAVTISLQQQLKQVQLAGTEEGKRYAIQVQYENTLRKISALKDQDYAASQRDTADQIKTAALAKLAFDQEQKRAKALRDAVAPLLQIRASQEANLAASREYNRLIMEGMLPAEAKRITEFNKQVSLLLQQKDIAIDLLQIEIDRAKLANQPTEDMQKRLDDLKKGRVAIEGEAAKGPGEGKSNKERIKDEVAAVKEELNKLLDPVNQVVGAAGAIGDAFSESFRGVIDGSMTAQQALANLFQRTADHFLDMTAQIIAAAIKMQAIQIIGSILGSAAGGFNSPAASPGGSAGVAGIGGGGLGDVFGNTSSFGAATSLPFAEGGYVNKPTNALIGEGGEPEYIIPESKMRESMSRYSNGSRGNSVIPANGGGPGMGDSGGGGAVAAPIDVRYTVERINSVDYITADQFQTGMRSAAEQGAKRGEQNTLKRLQMSGSTRKRLGL